MIGHVSVIGAGRSGAVTAACLAELGHSVRAVDVNEARVARLSAGRADFHEPGLDDLLRRNIDAGRLAFTTSVKEAVPGARYVLLSVDTPARSNGEADLTSLSAAIRTVAPLLAEHALVITRSTVPVGTNRWVAEQVRADNAEATFDVVSNPEFLREGHAVEDFLRPERVVIGAETPAAADGASRLYEGVDAPIVRTDLATAELIKYAANAFLATSISFINEIAAICERAGADVTQVSEALRMDARIGRKAYLSSGVGFGGSCLPKDLRALISSAEHLGYDAPLLKAVRAVNDEQPDHVIRLVETACGTTQGLTIALLGLSFTGETFDLRSSPAVAVLRRLIDAGARVRAFDPFADETASELDGAVELFEDAYAAAAGCDAAIIATEHRAFGELDLGRLRGAMRAPVLIDGRNVLDAAAAERAGFAYYSIGRPHRGD